MANRRVLVCRGSGCSKSDKKRKALLQAIKEVAEQVEEVRCQKMCCGPVAGVTIDGTLEWFAPLDTKKARARLVKLLTKGKMSRALAKRHRRKRSGKIR